MVGNALCKPQTGSEGLPFEAEAVDRLVDLSREQGKWTEPESKPAAAST